MGRAEPRLLHSPQVAAFSEPHQNAIATELVEILDEKQNSFLMGDFPFCREESGLCGSVSRALV